MFTKRRLIAGFLAAATVLLAGCTTPVIRSDVTAFHEWPNALPNKSYVFERTKEQDNNLEYRNYENLVRTELNRLGFTEAPVATSPALKAVLQYSMNVRDVREVYPVVMNPHWYGSPWYGHPWYGPWRGFYSPFYDPFWFAPPIVEQRESTYQLFTRQLRVTLAQMTDGKKLYETTVVSEGKNGALAAVMPYMVRSAFADFPGQSGVPRRVEMKMEK